MYFEVLPKALHEKLNGIEKLRADRLHHDFRAEEMPRPITKAKSFKPDGC